MESYKVTLGFTHIKYYMLMNKKSGNLKVIGYYDNNLLSHGVLILRNSRKCLSSLLLGESYCGTASTYLKSAK